MSSSHRHTESPTSLNQRIPVPIHRLSTNANYEFNNPSHSKETTVQWVNDPISGSENFQIKINIEGFNQKEVHIRVDGNKLFVHGERIENKSQGTSKKIIEEFYDLPPDSDTFRPHVTFPSPITMQVDFPSKHSSNEYTSPRKSNTNYDDLFNENRRIPIQRISINSRDSSVRPEHSNIPTYKFHQLTDTPVINKNSSTSKQTVMEIHRPRSSSPTLSNIIEEDSHRSITPPTDTSNDSSVFPQNFNSDVFYRSIFQPEIFTDDRNERYIEMKLNVHDYNPDDIKISINDNDLIVQVEHSNFYKQITLPSNIDLTSLSIHHHRDKILYLTIKLLDEYSSFKYI